MKYMLTNEETERLRFRLLNDNDFEAWKAMFSAENVGKFLALGEKLSVNELCLKWFEKIYTRYEKDLGGMNVLVRKDTGKMVGQCGLLIQTIEGETRLEIGYSILPEYWGNGYATEAAIKHRDFAFENNYWDTIISMVHVDNIASEIVAKRNGMTFEKKITEDDGEVFNIFGVTREEWEVAGRRNKEEF